MSNLRLQNCIIFGTFLNHFIDHQFQFLRLQGPMQCRIHCLDSRKTNLLKIKLLIFISKTSSFHQIIFLKKSKNNHIIFIQNPKKQYPVSILVTLCIHIPYPKEWKQNTLKLLCKPKFLHEIPNYGTQCSVILLALTPPQGPFPATYISNYVPMLIRESFSITIF